MLADQFRSGHAGRLQPQQNFSGDVLAVDRGGAMDRVAGGGELSRGVHEEAAAKIRPLKPLGQQVEECKNLPPRIAASMLAHVGQGFSNIATIAAVENRDNQVVLALKMFVERGLGNADGANDLVKPDRLKSGGVKEIPCSINEPVSRVSGHADALSVGRIARWVHHKCTRK